MQLYAIFVMCIGDKIIGIRRPGQRCADSPRLARCSGRASGAVYWLKLDITIFFAVFAATKACISASGAASRPGGPGRIYTLTCKIQRGVPGCVAPGRCGRGTSTPRHWQSLNATGNTDRRCHKFCSSCRTCCPWQLASDQEDSQQPSDFHWQDEDAVGFGYKPGRSGCFKAAGIVRQGFDHS